MTPVRSWFLAAGLSLASVTSQGWAQPQAEKPFSLDLTCSVIVITTGSSSVGGQVFVPGAAVPTSTNIPTQTQQAAHVVVEISGGNGRIDLPRQMVPIVHGGGDESWWPLYDLTVGDKGISARFRLNFVNAPRVTIDRMTGDIQIRGIGKSSFAGNCERAETERKF